MNEENNLKDIIIKRIESNKLKPIYNEPIKLPEPPKIDKINKNNKKSIFDYFKKEKIKKEKTKDNNNNNLNIEIKSQEINCSIDNSFEIMKFAKKHNLNITVSMNKKIN